MIGLFEKLKTESLVEIGAMPPVQLSPTPNTPLTGDDCHVIVCAPAETTNMATKKKAASWTRNFMGADTVQAVGSGKGNALPCGCYDRLRFALKTSPAGGCDFVFTNPASS